MKVTVDFTGVKDFVSVPPGEYVAQVENIIKKEGESGYPYLEWSLVIKQGAFKGLKIRHTTSLKPEALFNLRNTLIACGLKIPQQAITIDFNKVINKTLGIVVAMRASKTDPLKEYANVVQTKPASEIFDASSLADTEDTMMITEDDI